MQNVPWYNYPLQPKPLKDYWGNCSDLFYAHAYRSQLDELAMELQGGSGPKMYSRFNSESKAAEILTDRHGVFATVSIHGSEGAPYRAVVSLKLSPNMELFQEKFRAMFGRLSLEFRIMQ